MVDLQTVKKMAHLARLELSEDEKRTLGSQLLDILNFVQQLSEVNTDNIESLDILTGGTPMREDIPQKTLSQEDALMNAPQRVNGFFVVPRIVEV